MTATEQSLRNTFRTMDADHAQRIRDAYYKAVEGLRTLADTLEIADAEMPGPRCATAIWWPFATWMKTY